MNQEFNKSVENYKKAKEAFHKSAKESEIASLTLEKAKTDGMKDLKKLEKDLEKKRQISAKEEEEYKQFILAANLFMDKYYDELMPSILRVTIQEFQFQGFINNLFCVGLGI